MTNPATARLPLVVAAALFALACGTAEANRSASAAASETGAATAATQPLNLAQAAAQQPSAADPAATPSPVRAVVYKDANCGCCEKWVDHLRENGFTVVSHDVTDLDAVKRRHNIDRSLHSCHTAEIGGYVVEGHVPADLIHRMLRDRPEIAGIAVPGMPVGSPGMEWTYSEPYDVIAFTAAGGKTVYARR